MPHTICRLFCCISVIYVSHQCLSAGEVSVKYRVKLNPQKNAKIGVQWEQILEIYCLLIAKVQQGYSEDTFSANIYVRFAEDPDQRLIDITVLRRHLSNKESEQ